MVKSTQNLMAGSSHSLTSSSNVSLLLLQNAVVFFCMCWQIGLLLSASILCWIAEKQPRSVSFLANMSANSVRSWASLILYSWFMFTIDLLNKSWTWTGINFTTSSRGGIGGSTGGFFIHQIAGTLPWPWPLVEIPHLPLMCSPFPDYTDGYNSQISPSAVLSSPHIVSTSSKYP